MELLQIKMLNTAVERILNQEMAELGITYAQATVIGYLMENRHKDVCQRDIEFNLGLTTPTVSSILKRMEANQMIRTEMLPSDRRYKKIILTDQALSQSEEIDKKYKKVKKRIFSGISPAQREALNTTIQTILNNLQ